MHWPLLVICSFLLSDIALDCFLSDAAVSQLMETRFRNHESRRCTRRLRNCQVLVRYTSGECLQVTPCFSPSRIIIMLTCSLLSLPQCSGSFSRPVLGLRVVAQALVQHRLLSLSIFVRFAHLKEPLPSLIRSPLLDTFAVHLFAALRWSAFLSRCL